MSVRRPAIAVAAFVLVLLGLLAPRGTITAPVPSVAPAQAAPLTNLKAHFTATVLQGPDRGTTLTGTLQLRVVATGAISGTLTPTVGTALPVTGQLNGRLIGLYFNLAAGKNIFGTGVVGYDRFQKRTVLGGTFAGPSDTSTGVWAATDADVAESS
jgi:hypothetical protein